MKCLAYCKDSCTFEIFWPEEHRGFVQTTSPAITRFDTDRNKQIINSGDIVELDFDSIDRFDVTRKIRPVINLKEEVKSKMKTFFKVYLLIGAIMLVFFFLFQLLHIAFG